MLGHVISLLVPCLTIIAGAELITRKSTPPSAADFYVSGLPNLAQEGLPSPLHIHSGHIESEPHPETSTQNVTAHLFFVLVKARRTADKERVLFWFNGGPGCSSLEGLFMENGPWRIDNKGGLRLTEGGWEEYTTMIYVDQPAHTGFSYTMENTYVRGLTETTEQLMVFLKGFYEIFPEYQTMDTYLGGESFAGTYIPYFAESILKSGTLSIPLRGIALGNPWIDGRSQYSSYVEYAVHHGFLTEGSTNHTLSKETAEACLAAQYSGSGPDPVFSRESSCVALIWIALSEKQRTREGKPQCLNIYDTRLFDTMPGCGVNWPPDLPNITTYLRRPDVISALHATAKKGPWAECQQNLNEEFNRGNQSMSAVHLLPDLLKKIEVLFYVGDKDIACNHIGIENTIKALKWNGAQGLGAARTLSWMVNNTPAGTWVSSRNLTYVKVFNASHMVPYNVPVNSHDMILRFMGVNFTIIEHNSALMSSAMGTIGEAQHHHHQGATAEKYFIAKSIAVVVISLAFAISGIIWYRLRRTRPIQKVERGDEFIPLRGEEDDL